MDQNLLTIIITLITVLGSAGAWKFYDTRLNKLDKQRIEEKVDENAYRDDLRSRINNLEQLLIESAKEKSKMVDTIIHLTRQIATLETKVKYLEKENEILTRIK
jgi:septal ring factor EnvC (AmiA/AmiB activator)